MRYKFLLFFFTNNSLECLPCSEDKIQFELKKDLNILFDFHLFCMSFKYQFNMINKDPDVKNKFDENLKILAKKYEIYQKNTDYEYCIKVLKKMKSKCSDKIVVKAFENIIKIIDYHYVQEEYKNNPMINPETQLIATNFAIHSNVQYILENSKFVFDGKIEYKLDLKIDLHNI